MFSYRNFLVSSLTFKSLIYFEFTFVYGINRVVQINSFPCSFPISPVYWRSCLFLTVYSCPLCHRLIDHKCVGLFLYSDSLMYVSVFVPIPHCSGDCSFVIYSELRDHGPSRSVFLSQDYFGYLLSFVVQYKF